MKYTKQDLINLSKICADTDELECDNERCPGFGDCNSEELMGAGVPSSWTGKVIECIYQTLNSKKLAECSADRKEK